MEVVDASAIREFSPESFQKRNLFETERLFSDVYAFEPGQEQSPHSHEDADKVYYVLEGQGTFVVGDEERVVGQGEAVIAPAGAAHGVRNESDDRLRTLVFLARDTGQEEATGHDHGQHDADQQDTPHDHTADAEHLAFSVVTVSSTRSRTDDASGTTIRDLAEAADHEVVHRTIVPDDVTEISAAVEDALAADVDVVVVTGGTGLTPDDVTIEALRPLFQREIPGFGEEFRRRSTEQVGLAGLLSRATAGVVDETPVFALPGSENAVALGVTDLILPQLDHLLHLVRS